jgi:hypothetical protein
MLKISWLLTVSIIGCLTIQPSQSQVPSRLGENKPAGQETANSRFGSQTRDSLDVRDAGVDCGFSSDSSVALNAITARASSNGLAIVFPPGCHVKLARTWVVKNLAGFSIRGTSGAGAAGYYGFQIPTITWIGATGGTMIDMEYVDGFVVESLAIDGNGIAAVGINVDKTGAGGAVNTTDGIFRRLYVHGNASGRTANANWEGIVFSNVSGQNVEDMRVFDSTMYCGPSSSSGVAGIVIGASFNAKNFQFIHNEIHQCAIGVWQKNGAMDLEYSELGGNDLDIRVDDWSDPNEVISHNLSESDTKGARFLNISGPAPAHPIEISGNNIPLNDTCAMNISNASVKVPVGNTWYPAFRMGTGGTKVCNTTGAGNPASLSGSLYSLSSVDFSKLVMAQNVHNGILGDGASSIPSFLIKSTGSLLLERGVFYGPGDVIDGLTTASGGGQAVTPCGVNSWCGMEGALEVTGTDTPEGISCTVTGGGSRKIYGFYISAQDSSGNETLLRGGSPYFACHGPSTLDASHYLTLNWLGSPNASSCNVYAVNTNDARQVKRIATHVNCASSGTHRVTSYPESFPIKTPESLYNKTLAFLLRGKELDFQYGTPLNGFSDKGITKTWGIDTRGTADFSGLKLGASGSDLSQMKIYSTSSITPTAVPATTCSDQTFALEGVTTADRVSNVTPPGTLGNISINAYILARDTLLLHFCNPSAFGVSPPRGIYSLLAVH